MPKRIMQGTVVSDHGDKTIVVQVERRFRHPLLNKIVRKSKRFMAHDENNTHKTGDTVRIVECRPHSKRKTWEVVTDEASA